MSHATPVLVVEDEPISQEAMVHYLNMKGFAADGVTSVEAAETWMQTHWARVVLLDLELPGEDGLAWLQRTTVLDDTAVVIVSARGERDDRLTGLDAGADGYLVKPVDMEEMTTLVRNLSRRLGGGPAANWQLDELTWLLTSPDGEALKLTASEVRILKGLADQAGDPVARDTLIAHLGESPDTYDPRRMEILIRRLRNKAREELSRALPLETVRGYGYAFTDRIELTAPAR